MNDMSVARIMKMCALFFINHSNELIRHVGSEAKDIRAGENTNGVER